MRMYFSVLAARFRQVMSRLGELPTNPRSLFYERWEIAFFEERRRLSEQAQKARTLELEKSS